MFLFWLLLSAGIGAGGTVLILKRDISATLIPGQVWTVVALVHPTKAWTDMSKSSVAIAVRIALSNAGIIPIDAFWSGDYQLTVAASTISTTQLSTGAVLALNSEWADQATITSINQAPASVPVAIPHFP